MATPLEDHQACPGNPGDYLAAVLHRREAILSPPNHKGRAGDARQIGPSVRPAEEGCILLQEHRRTRASCHPPEATRCIDGMRSTLMGNGCREVLHYCVEFPTLDAVVPQARRVRISMRTWTASHQPQPQNARGCSGDYLQGKASSIGGSREEEAKGSLSQDGVRRFCHGRLRDRQGDRLDEISQAFDLGTVEFLVAEHGRQQYKRTLWALVAGVMRTQ